jgi:hypothetical protein
MTVKPPIDLSTDIALPVDKDELARCLADPMWRICSGLYKILVKGDDDDEGTILNFKPNRAQRRFIARLWHRNLILKARQLGMTTLVCILWLDHALFNANQRCGIIAHDRDSAANIFRDKVKFAYEHLPEALKNSIRVVANNASEILFSNNSSIRVATSMRSGTIHRLHVSEYGKICALYPHKAREVMTGSLPAVPITGITVIESTAEGQDGDFYKKTQQAQELADLGRELSPKDFRFHFYAWWQEPKYRMSPAGVNFTPEYQAYFEEIEAMYGMTLDIEQRAWYIATKEVEFSGDDETMWREYPSYPEEAFKVSTEGSYFAKQLTMARRDGRITTVPFLTGYPVYTFWDLGLNDLQAIWFMQAIGMQHRFIRYYENSGEGVSHYVHKMQEFGYVYGGHYLPHDGAARRPTLEKPETYEDMLRRMSVRPIHIVPRITHKTIAIDMMREQFPQCWFDERNCAVGLKRLQNYKKEWNERLQTWGEQPRHDDNSNAADAIMQYAQGFKGTRATVARQRKSNWRTA